MKFTLNVSLFQVNYEARCQVSEPNDFNILGSLYVIIELS